MRKVTSQSDVPCLVYQITCLVTGKCYIGVTIKTVHQRWNQHCKEARATRFDTVFYRAIRKYGEENFSISVLYEAVNAREAQKVERALIGERRTLAPFGMNTSTGGESHAGRAMTEEVKEKIRQKKIGTKMSEEACRRMSEARTGRKHSPESIKKMCEAQARPDVKAKQKAAMDTDEYRTKQKAVGSKVMKALWADPAFRKRSEDRWKNGVAYQKARKALRLATTQRSRTKHETMLERWQDPDYRAKMMAQLSANAKNEKRRAATIAANRARAGKQQSHTTKAKKAAYMKQLWSDPKMRVNIVEGNLRRIEKFKFGPSTAGARALFRKLPTDYFPRGVSHV